MFRKKPREESVGFCESLENLCMCSPFWECVLDDPDYYSDSLTLRHRVSEWNYGRKLKKLERQEAKLEKQEEKKRERQREQRRRSRSRERQRRQSRSRSRSKERRRSQSRSKRRLVWGLLSRQNKVCDESMITRTNKQTKWQLLGAEILIAIHAISKSQETALWKDCSVILDNTKIQSSPIRNLKKCKD